MTTQKMKLVIVREFDAPKKVVFDAFANKEAMAEWWGPVDYPTTVLQFDFRPGGIFHFKMDTPGFPMWARFKYGVIQEPDVLEFINSFCNEKAEVVEAPIAPGYPREILNRLTFTEKDGKTTMTMVAYPVNSTDKEYAVFEGMEQSMDKGYNGTFDQLEKYIDAQFKLRKEMKTGIKARTTTYLNFPGNTEEAFNFYKSVFKTEFNGEGVKRFGEIPAQAGHPPVADNVKKMVLHVELPILGGHVLMGTDASKEMGFTVIFGNNSHICLEPETKKEAKYLFDALSAGGNVTMPLQDMFWGAYYGSFTDKFGVNWMVNCIAQ